MNLENKMMLLIQLLKKKGIKFNMGLTEEELTAIEAKFDLKFPPDLQMLLSLALPISRGFVNWRLALTSKKHEAVVRKRLAWPVAGLTMDIQNGCWYWGDQDEATIMEHLTKSTKLIPIYSHRYIPCKPCEAGNPVFSIMYTLDIIYYGYDLVTYFQNEFHFSLPDNLEIPQSPRKIEFWSNLV